MPAPAFHQGLRILVVVIVAAILLCASTKNPGLPAFLGDFGRAPDRVIKAKGICGKLPGVYRLNN